MSGAASFGFVVKIWREMAGIQQKDLAAQLGLSAAYLCDIEQGRRTPPQDATIQRMAVLLDMPADYLFHYAGRVPPDCRDWDVTANTAVKAYGALRRVLASEEDLEA